VQWPKQAIFQENIKKLASWPTFMNTTKNLRKAIALLQEHGADRWAMTRCSWRMPVKRG
jgi:hypothetical protein